MSDDPINFVRQHGVVLESAKGPVVNLAEAVAGTPIRGNWWSHKDSKRIFAATRQIRGSEDVLVCRLVEDKVTYVHRRLWPALVRLAIYFPKEKLSAIREEHSREGAHITKKLQFPKWVPSDVRNAANLLSVEDAAAQFGPWIATMLQLCKTQSRSVPPEK